MKTNLHDSAARLDTRQWTNMYGSRRIDRSRAYALFREHMEPGAGVVVTSVDDDGPCAALHGAVTTPGSGLFSHPWKLLTSEQLRRTDVPGGEEARKEHEELLRRVVGGTAAPDAASLGAVLGEALVFRGFDTTEVGLRPDLEGAARHRALRALLLGAKDAVRRGLAGAVCLPFVRRDDLPLKEALAEAGFRMSELTAASEFDLAGQGSYEEFLDFLPGRRRRLHRKEQRALADSALRIDTWPLGEHVEEVAVLEARNIAKHGGIPDHAALVTARQTMADLLEAHIRVPVAVRESGEGDRLAACGIHLADEDDYCILMYGADEEVIDGSPVYPYITFYEPLRHAAEHGLSTVRMGFEAFSAKLRRGAVLSRRETWLWAPDSTLLDALHKVMEFLGERTALHLAASVR